MKKYNLDYAKLLGNLPGLYLILSTDLKIITANDAYASATMIDKHQVVGKGLFEVFPDNPDDKNADGVSNLSKSLNSVLKNKRTHSMAIQKYDIQKPDGTFEVRYWSPMNVPVLNENNEIECIIHRAVDVTESVVLKNEQLKNKRKTADLEKKVLELETETRNRTREIQKLNDELEQKIEERTKLLMESEALLRDQNALLTSQNKELRQYTYITSHDLQEPLRTLVSFSDLLQKKYGDTLDEKGKRYIQFISQASNRMKELVKVLMDYSRVGQESKLVQVDCNETINDVLNDLSLIIQETKATISVEQLPIINAYSVELRQLFQNLISNALKFKIKDTVPVIHVSVVEQPNEWLFSVKDNGIGIEEKDIDILFQVFKRLHSRADYQGTGIGLALCKKITELHGGKIWVESTPNKGSIFKFTITKQ